MTEARKAIFAQIKAAMGGASFTMDDVTCIDAMLDRRGFPRDGVDNGWLNKAMELIKQFEGCRLSAYPDPGTGGKPITIGFGSTSDEEGGAIRIGDKWTLERAESRLAKQVQEFATGVDKALAGSAVTAGQKAAMVSLAYNIGLGAFSTSTLLKKHRAGDYAGAKSQFGVWNRAGGHVMNGLTNRRREEAKVYAS